MAEKWSRETTKWARELPKAFDGLAKGRPDSDFDPEELAMGIKVELEHTKDLDVAKQIAKDHLAEHDGYYTALKKMEDNL